MPTYRISGNTQQLGANHPNLVGVVKVDVAGLELLAQGVADVDGNFVLEWVGWPGRVAVIAFDDDATAKLDLVGYDWQVGIEQASTEVDFLGSEERKFMASASSQLNSTLVPGNGFNGIFGTANNTDSWGSTQANNFNPDGSCFFQLDFQVAKTISQIRLNTIQIDPKRAPKLVRILVSNDPAFVNFSVAHIGEFNSPGPIAFTDFLVMTNPSFGRHLRMEVHSAGSSLVQFQEIEFKELI